ncbi:shikimate kinase [Arthrobacter sp. AL08]|uniref:shikimate kinase n=1 Tax=unclassified Arthrobacter TaxID=235627 RepID=UPI001D000A30|nr:MULTISPECIES: shikimate kinase [unclassified Arthrobacter]MCB5282531.1 Shikimate kinase [Arthrobacter sp. ES1]MDI3242858.1 shikimate kinase [Arthrobacter sp. AL05]MDI3278879.1 shikimate kinase [Arthrobacter sp. AL08]WGZ81232.1 shikimate kinase [Arthrobacter sp. EM1]
MPAGPARNAARPIVLIGPMAVGKSAIGYQLAQQLGATFVDTDVTIVANHGSIAEIFASRGEHVFRELEARAVARALEDAQGRNTVVSLGGGAVLDSGTQQLLGHCTVVYLECDAGTVVDRIARNSGRPLLAGDAMERWKALFATRRPVYERLADLVFDVRNGTVADIAHRLEDALRAYGAAGTAGVPAPAATKEVEK